MADMLEEEFAEDEFIGGDNYPPEFIAPSQKEKRAYGLSYAKAMYATSNRNGMRYLDNPEYQALIEVAQGRQSVNDIYKLFGYHREDGDMITDDGSQNLAYIDIQVLNLGPKYINRAVAKMQKYSYDISVDAVDPVSIDEKLNYAATLGAFYRLNDWMVNMGADPKEMFPDLDIDSLPRYPDEMLYDIETNPKIKKEISAEIAIKLLHYVNEYKQKMRETDWYIVVLGKGHLHFFNDANGFPRVESIHPKFHIGSWVQNENYTDQENAGFMDFITVNQLRKEMLADGWSEMEIKAIADQWRGGVFGTSSPEFNGNWNSYDGLDYIPVMRFYFKSEDNRSFYTKKNKYGDDIIFETSFNYKPEEEEVKQDFESGERRLIRNSYTSIYGGTWILDTDVVFGYGRKNYPRTNLVEASLPIKTFAPNMKDGRVVSFCAQMIEPLRQINVAWNKIKEILAKGWMGVREIDFTQLESIAMGKGGTEWTPREVYEHLLKTNTLIKRSALNKYDQNAGGAGVVDSPSGLQLADYFTTLTTSINILEQMTSTSVVDSISVPDRLSATAAKQSAITSDVDMEYLYNAHENLYLQGSHMLLLLLQESLKDGNKVQGFIPALGKVNTGLYQADESLAYCECGLTMSKQPTAEQWAEFYEDIRIALTNKEISIADAAFIREIDNLKQARQIMVIRNKQYQRQLREEAQFNNDLAIQSNQAAAEAKLNGELMKIQEKGRIDYEIKILDGKIKGALINQEKELEGVLSGLDNQVKERINKQTVLGTVLKEAMRSRVENRKSDRHLQSTIVSAQQKAESDMKKLNAPKPKVK